MLRDQNIILFADDDWTSAYRTSKHHLAKRLAECNHVFWVNSVGLRRPTVSGRDLKRIVKKLRLFGRGLQRPALNLAVFSPIALPFHGLPWIDSFNFRLLTFLLRRCLGKLGWTSYQAWVFLPTAGRTAVALAPTRLIYYCTDEFSAFAGIDRTAVRAMERDLLTAADTVFVTSRRLLETKSAQHAHVRYIPHGVDVKLFAQAREQSGDSSPPDIAGISSPILGFYGLMTAEWVDFALLEFIVRQRPNWSLVLIGTMGEEGAALLDQPNVHFLGAKPYDELYRYSACFDLALLPFVRSELTLSANPLKIREYLAAGLPVVSLRLPELEEFSELIAFADDKEAFLRSCDEALRDRSPEAAARRSAAVANSSWEARLELIEAALAPAAH